MADWWIWLFLLGGLLLLSAFFSGSETAMNSVNRYRLAHRARQNEKWAIRTIRLLRRPDRLLGIILVGNNIANIITASLVTLLATQIWGEFAVAPAGFVLTLCILVFAEIVPKNVAASRPEGISRLVALPLSLLLTILFPLVWLANLIAGVLLRLFGVSPEAPKLALARDELKVALEMAGEMLPEEQLRAMLSVLGLTELTVADVMVPHTEIVGLDLEDDIEQIRAKLQSGRHNRMPVYRRSIDEVIGFISLKSLSSYLGSSEAIDPVVMENFLSPASFVPETTSLYAQLRSFRERSYTIAMVVDEHGNVRGLVTVRDLIAEIAGELDPELKRGDGLQKAASEDGSYVLEGTALVREINRDLGWALLDTDDSRTLNGLILEQLESIPQGNVCLEIGDYRLETLRIEEQTVRRVRISPVARPEDQTGEGQEAKEEQARGRVTAG